MRLKPALWTIGFWGAAFATALTIVNAPPAALYVLIAIAGCGVIVLTYRFFDLIFDGPHQQDGPP